MCHVHPPSSLQQYRADANMTPGIPTTDDDSQFVKFFCKMNKTVLALRNKQGKYIIPKFADCLLEFFGSDINSVRVDLSVENGTLVLNESEDGYELSHSPHCPVKLFKNSSGSSEDDQEDDSKNSSQIRLASSVAVESSDAHILLTRRSPNLRSSPNIWVLPGGHLEYGETVFEAGVRETKEETALDVISGKSSVLGCWESVYPILLGLGKPKYHVLIVYLHVQLDETYEELTKRIIPSPEEVSSYCWINARTLSHLLNFNEDEKLEGKQYAFENGKIVEKNLNYRTMFRKFTWNQMVPYSGVNFALRKWLEKVNLREQKSKF